MTGCAGLAILGTLFELPVFCRQRAVCAVVPARCLASPRGKLTNQDTHGFYIFDFLSIADDSQNQSQ